MTAAGAPTAVLPRSRSSLRSVALPTEHGGWSLTAEPVLLGLIVAWSWAGLALGVAAMVAFLSRTPLKVVLVDWWRHRRLPRTRLAARVAAVELAVIAGLSAVAVVAGETMFWVPLAVAAPLVVTELWFDMRSRGRRLVPELAGTVGMGSVATAIAVADGSDTAVAVGLWCVVAARGAAAIPYVRVQLARGHHRPHRLWHSDLPQLLAAAAVAVAWSLDAVPLAALVAVAAVASLNLAWVRRPPRRAVVIGIQQTLLGLAVVGITAAGILVA